jgi:hypothetical protein
VSFVATLVEPLADGIRRAMLLGGSAGEDLDLGVLVLAADDSVEMANRAAQRWLDELRSVNRPGARLPLVIHAVAGRTRQATAGGSGTGVGADGGIARARARTRAGRWVLVRGSLVGDGPGSRVAILLEEARAPELAPLIAEAYGFTRGELVAQLFFGHYAPRLTTWTGPL